MSQICSCQMLSRGVKLVKKPARLFSISSANGYNKQCLRQNNFPVYRSYFPNSYSQFPVIEKGQGIKFFSRDSSNPNDKYDKSVAATSTVNVETEAESKKDHLSSAKGQLKDGQNEFDEENLTDEERAILREIEEEERRIRENLGAKDLTNYNIWDDKSLTFTEADLEEERKLTQSVKEGHVHFRDQKRIIQDVIDEMWNPLPESEFEEEEPVIYPRGKTGMFDLGELVDLLREENGEEIVAIKMPEELDYADFMVIVTVNNNRQLLALATFVRKRCKMKELKPTDKLPFLEKTRNHQGWIALDLGNIILHLMLQDVRDYYDLEMLWTVGPLYDDLTHAKDPEIVQLLNTLK